MLERKPANGVYEGRCEVRMLPPASAMRAVNDDGKVGGFIRWDFKRKSREKRTQCINGHLYTPENTKIRVRLGTERRVCRICERARKANDKRKR